LKAPYVPSRIEYYPNGKTLPGGLTLWLIDTDYFKDFTARRMQAEEGKPIRWHVHRDVTMLYAEQVTAERKVPIRNRRTGKVHEEWQPKKSHYRTEAWDAEVYAAAAADMAGLKYLFRVEQGKDAKPKPPQAPQPSVIESRRNVREFNRPGWLER
jgi:phage terminase large subunit GpA-like protein